jgi:hypothetical protein
MYHQAFQGYKLLFNLNDSRGGEGDMRLRIMQLALVCVLVSLLSVPMLGCRSEAPKTFYWDAALTDAYVPPKEDPAGGQPATDIAAGGQVYQNKYGSVLIPAGWIPGKNRDGVDVKNLANGAVFRSSESDDAEIVTVMIYHNPVCTPEHFDDWFDAYYTQRRIYTFGEDYTFAGITYRSMTYDSILGGTDYQLQALNSQNIMVEVTLHNLTPEDANARYVLDHILLKEQ